MRILEHSLEFDLPTDSSRNIGIRASSTLFVHCCPTPSSLLLRECMGRWYLDGVGWWSHNSVMDVLVC
jgi:hypothetical protein